MTAAATAWPLEIHLFQQLARTAAAIPLCVRLKIRDVWLVKNLPSARFRFDLRVMNEYFLEN
jgi:hypothetical protein